MAGGQLNKPHIGFIIQARMKSVRLPNKVLTKIPLGNGKPILQWIIDELKKSTLKGEIIVATSLNLENDILSDYCQLKNIKCFRGEEENVLSRFIAIQKEENFEIIVRLTGDNPILDISILDKAIQFHLENKNDYTKTEGLPLGMNLEIISATELLDLENKDLSDEDKEHVTLFISKSDAYKKGIYKPILNTSIANLRVTIDYPSDFTVVSVILSLLNENNKEELGVQLIEKIYKDYPWVFDANVNNIQKKQFLNLKDEISEACKILEKYDLKQALSILKSN